MRTQDRAVPTPWSVDELDLTRGYLVETPRKVWELIFDDLKGKILSGQLEFTDGAESYLRSERQLVEEYGVARPTIQQALRALQGEGLIETQRGKNTGGA